MYKCKDCEKESNNKNDFVFVFDMSAPGYYCKEHVSFCNNCKHAVNNDKLYGDLCYNCFNKLKRSCESCGKISKELYNTETSRLCKNCLEGSGFIQCPNCYSVTKKDDLIYLEDNNIFGCDNCKEQCKNCMMYETPSEMIIINKKKYCSDCVANCSECGKQKPKSELYEEETENAIGDIQTIFKCKECYTKCERCDNFGLKSELNEINGVYFCNECYDEKFSNCHNCNEVYSKDDLNFFKGEEYCQSCFDDIFSNCKMCLETFKKYELNEIDEDDYYCDNCLEKQKAKNLSYFKEYNKTDVSLYNEQHRILSQLKKIELPISIENFKIKYSALANQLKNFLGFVKSKKEKNITKNLIIEYENGLNKEEFPLEYSTWDSQLQRSVESSNPQLVINIIASNEMLNDIKSNNSYILFDLINNTSKESGHPYVKDQIGWVRLELNKEKKYILVDEIQTDHLNAIDRIYTETYQGKKYYEHIKNRYNLTDEQFKAICDNLKKNMKRFSDIALDTVVNFAKQNGFVKIYYHTYESGKALKNNDPPKSMYTKVPERHYFKQVEEKPFDLEGKFLAREATYTDELLKRFARKINMYDLINFR